MQHAGKTSVVLVNISLGYQMADLIDHQHHVPGMICKYYDPSDMIGKVSSFTDMPFCICSTLLKYRIPDLCGG
jgi:hypothetical protein